MQSLLLASNPVFGAYDTGIYVFTFPIQYYAIVIVCGMILAALWSALLMKRRNMDPSLIMTLFVVCIPSAIVGARLFSCLTDPKLGIESFFDFPWAGLSITGGVVGGVLAGLVVCLCCRVSFLRAADCVVITILFAQAIGRWGNYFNQEVYGGVVNDPNMQWFPFAVFIEERGEWHYAFFFYEMIANLIGFAILYSLAWRCTKKPNGIFTCAYFVWYGTVRAIMEPLRDGEFILDNGGIPWSEVSWIILAGAGIIGIMSLLIINFKREGSFFGSKTGDPCGITKYLSSDKNATPYFSKINILGANYPPAPEKPKKSEKPEKSPKEKGEEENKKDL